MTIISLHSIRSVRSALCCEPIPPQTERPVKQAIIPAPTTLLIAYSLRAHLSGRLDAATADRLIRRLLASGDAAAQVVAGFILERHRLPDASPPTAGTAAMVHSPQSVDSSTDRRSS
ncbi:hypothetical protein VQ042_14650 [Aurantimonas sp. A2-1-M11]|uniref:hypothetical protein n=1 Tax=Aurantimonas sp. A2-1-M11 TaxID=3113712 RepID=UPI002F941E88